MTISEQQTLEVQRIDAKYARIYKRLGRTANLIALSTILVFGGLYLNKTHQSASLEQPKKHAELIETRATLHSLYKTSEALENLSPRSITLDFPYKLQEFTPTLEREIEHHEERVADLARLPEVRAYVSQKKNLESQMAHLHLAVAGGLTFFLGTYILGFFGLERAKRKEKEKVSKVDVKEVPTKPLIQL